MQVYDSYDEAVAALPHTPGAGDELRKESADCRQRAQDSFDRCDTDGFLSQWASNCTASKREQEASLADYGNQHVFQVLVDTATGRVVGEKLFTFFNKFAGYGSRRVWLVLRNGGKEWVGEAKRESTYTRKGLRTAYVIAEAFIGCSDDNPCYKLEPARGMPTGPINYYPIRKWSSYTVEG